LREVHACEAILVPRTGNNSLVKAKHMSAIVEASHEAYGASLFHHCP
jgi:hypothetical protein